MLATWKLSLLWLVLLHVHAHTLVLLEEEEYENDGLYAEEESDGDDDADVHYCYRNLTTWETPRSAQEFCHPYEKVLIEFADMSRQMDDLIWKRSSKDCACRCQSCGACISENIPCGYYHFVLGCFPHCFYIDKCMAGRGRLWRHPNDLEYDDTSLFYDFRLKAVSDLI